MTCSSGLAHGPVQGIGTALRGWPHRWSVCFFFWSACLDGQAEDIGADRGKALGMAYANYACRKKETLPPGASEVPDAIAKVCCLRVIGLKLNDEHTSHAKFKLAQILVAEGNRDEGRGMIEELARRDYPLYPEAVRWMAEDLLRTQQEGQTISEDELAGYFSKLLSTSIRGTASLWLQGARLSLKKKGMTAQQFAQRCEQESAIYCKAHPTDTEAREAWGESLMIQNRLEDALAVVREGIKLAGTSPSLSRQESKILVELFRQELNRSKESDPRNPEYPWGRLEEALKADPLNPQVGEEIASATVAKSEVASTFQEALREQLVQGVANTITHVLVGRIYANQKKFDLARKHLEIAKAMEPDSTLAASSLALVLTAIDPPDMKTAQELISEAVSRDPSNSELLDIRGQIYFRTGNWSEAIASFEKALKLNPGRTRARRKLIEAYREFGMSDMAEAHDAILQSNTR